MGRFSDLYHFLISSSWRRLLAILAPGFGDLDLDPALAEPATGVADELGRDATAAEVLGLFDRRLVGHDQHPAGRTEARLRIDELVRDDHVGTLFEDKVR